MNDVPDFLEALRRRRIFDPGAPVTIARAPGRLDVMGGIADYSGSLVLQRPIAEATFAALQLTDTREIEIVSFGRAACTVSFDALCPEGTPIAYDASRTLFEGEDRWAAYVVGVFLVLMRERGVRFRRGVKIAIGSSVPEGKGVSSSAALEVAAMQAATAAFDVSIAPRQTALLCQMAENRVAGAPCGVMDQMTSVCGEADALVALLCQPAELEPAVPVPDDIGFWGMDSGERHAVGGSDYSSVRAAAFMGYRVLAGRTGKWNGYLANIGPAELEAELLSRLPEKMSGREFMARYGDSPDTVTTVDPGRTYRIQRSAIHPIYEHHRVNMFRQLLAAPASDERLVGLGELMFQSHQSYSDCGLGSPGTDRLVHLVRTRGRLGGLYGARITGGGSGGTVAVIGRRDAADTIAGIAREYESATGHRPYIFSGSSPGAMHSGTRTLTL